MDFGAHLPLMDFGGHPYTLDHLVGYTEASRGCRHLCRHCPVVPVYRGTFRVVQPEVVFADIRNQVAAGAQHITFGDPDFFNGPTHAMRIVEALHRWINGKGFSFENSQQIARDHAEALWNGALSISAPEALKRCAMAASNNCSFRSADWTGAQMNGVPGQFA